MRRAIKTLLSLSVMWGVLLVTLHVQAGERLVVAYATSGETQAPLWVSKESGAFARHGLDVELVFIEGGSRTIQAMLAGDAPITVTAGPEVVQAVLKGAPIVSIASTLHTY